MSLAYWIHDLSPFALRFSDSVGIRWYGLAYIAGFAIAVYLLRYMHAKGRSPLDAEVRMRLLVYGVAGVLIGGRVGYALLYQTQNLLREPLSLFYVWEGGMASHGGILGVAVALALFVHRQNKLGLPHLEAQKNQACPPLTLFSLGDLVCTVAGQGIFLGRLANFVNGELWGRVSRVPWAVIFPDAQRTPHFEPDAFQVPIVLEGVGQIMANPRHPSQLYAAVLEGLVLFLLMQWRFWKTGVTLRHPGQLSGEFLIAYALLRFTSEIFREPDAALILGLSRGVFYSLFIAVAGALVMLWARSRSRPATDTQPPEA
jgi:phosphatidylglycerol:prolipoprotein diacylglycerol transferase